MRHPTRNTGQLLFDDSEPTTTGLRQYLPILTAVENGKGVLDVDTVKGCSLGMLAYPHGGCYGECYAAKTAARYGIDFSTSVTRQMNHRSWRDVFCIVRDHPATWYRVGTAGDPSHDWEHTVAVCEALKMTGKAPVIITKHWVTASDDQLKRLKAVSAVINTSTSGMDSNPELYHRVGQIGRIQHFGIVSVCRVVTCEFGNTEWGRECREKQDYLLSIEPSIDNPLRASQINQRVLSGDIILTKHQESRGGGKYVSLHSESVYLGTCATCPDQCGVQNPLSTKRK